MRLAADKVRVVLATVHFAGGCLARLPGDLSEYLSSRQRGIGGPESFVKISRGRFEIASLLGIENVDTSVEINDIHDRILSVKVQTNAMPTWCETRQVNSTVGVGH